MAKTVKKKKKTKEDNTPINGSFDDVISASVKNVGFPHKSPQKSTKKQKK